MQNCFISETNEAVANIFESSCPKEEPSMQNLTEDSSSISKVGDFFKTEPDRLGLMVKKVDPIKPLLKKVKDYINKVGDKEGIKEVEKMEKMLIKSKRSLALANDSLLELEDQWAVIQNEYL